MNSYRTLMRLGKLIMISIEDADEQNSTAEEKKKSREKKGIGKEKA